MFLTRCAVSSAVLWLMAVLLVGEDMVAPQWGEHRAVASHSMSRR
jgi:hypothetical protein